MGAVYLSTHLGTERLVALKVISADYTRTPELVERFRREARAAGRLRHPNIVDVTDFGIAELDHQRVPYLVMEYLDGRTLGDVLEEQPKLPLPAVVEIMEQVCSAVHAAHQRKIIHRDLKPANIWLEPNTLGGFTVKVLDFGVAKLADELEPTPEPAAVAMKSSASPTESRSPADASATSPSQILTQAGAILGTPLYMAPEQCRGEATDARSDIYSLGVITYRMLCGATPFTGSTSSVLRAHQENEPPPLEKNGAKVPKAVSRLVLNALVKDPGQRPQSAIAFAHLLRANTDTLSALYRRALALYVEYLPKIFKLSLIAYLPVFLITVLELALTSPASTPARSWSTPVQIFFGIATILAMFVANSIITGMVTVIVTQLSVAPLRPVKLRSAFLVLRRRWWFFIRTQLAVLCRIALGLLLCLIPALYVMASLSYSTPVVLLEGLVKGPVLKRSRQLAKRSPSVAMNLAIFQIVAPMLVSAPMNSWVSLGMPKVQALAPTFVNYINILFNSKLSMPTDPASVTQVVLALCSVLSSFLVMPLLSIVVALAYLKLRQLGGEDVVELLPQIEPEEGNSARNANPH
jgi:serine/threonine protein kinase